MTSYNGSKTNYDFGRYKGRYKDSWVRRAGPAIYKKSQGEPKSSTHEGYQKFEFKVSKELDNAIATKFEKTFQSGKKNIPTDVKNRMLQKGKLGSNERYADKDWSMLGPNCLTNTLDTLKAGLGEIRESDKYDSSLRQEASKVFDVIEDIGSMTFSPAGAKSELIDAAKQHDFISAEK
ncbi:MAG: hypothetical protein ACYC04_10300 [Sulfurovum sp.]